VLLTELGGGRIGPTTAASEKRYKAALEIGRELRCKVIAIKI
jgi:hypothetical protein